MLDERTRLELIAEAVRYSQRARAMGMPVAGYTKTAREAIHSVWTLRFGSKARAAKYRSRDAEGLTFGRRKICFDHAIPYRYELQALMALRKVTPETVRPVLDKFDIHAIITKVEHDRLAARGLGSKMPERWNKKDPLARYKAARIALVENEGFGKLRETTAKLTHEEIVNGMRKLRKRIKPGKMSVREMIAEGRRF